MDVKSTINLTRAEALLFIRQYLYKSNSKVLERLVEEINDGLYKANSEEYLGFQNFRIQD